MLWVGDGSINTGIFETFCVFIKLVQTNTIFLFGGNMGIVHGDVHKL